MLKTIKTVAVIAVFYGAFSSVAQADVAEDLQNICTIVKADDKSELRKKMKKVESDYRLKLQDYYTGISCEGESLIRTAFLNNALETGELMIKKMPKSLLNSPESDGKTLQAWVSERQLMASPIASVLNERI